MLRTLATSRRSRRQPTFLGMLTGLVLTVSLSTGAGQRYSDPSTLRAATDIHSAQQAYDQGRVGPATERFEEGYRGVHSPFAAYMLGSSFARLIDPKCALKYANVTLQGQPQPTLSGVYRIRQLSTSRYLDAHQTGDRDFAAVTRPHQSNPSQKWILRSEGSNLYRVQQRGSGGQYLDAHDTPDKDFAVVTRPYQPNDTQRWIFSGMGNNIYTIQQVWTRRYLDAHDTQDRDFAVVTRPSQPNATQRWVVTKVQ